MDVHGQVDARFGPVRECFAEMVRGQAGTEAAFTAWCDGRPVADLWAGWADQGRTRPWEQGSLVQPYSVSKTPRSGAFPQKRPAMTSAGQQRRNCLRVIVSPEPVGSE
jgi:hypothetical protein